MWSALTEPARLADWMGAAEVEPNVGGCFNLMVDGPNPMTGRVLVWEPHRVLEFSWLNSYAPESVVRFELARDHHPGADPAGVIGDPDASADPNRVPVVERLERSRNSADQKPEAFWLVKPSSDSGL